MHQVGVAMMAYMQDSRDRMPHVSLMPSISAAPLDLDKPAVYLAEVLRKHLKGANAPRELPGGAPPAPGSPIIMTPGGGGALECSDDRPGVFDRSEYAGRTWSYYQTERSSYQYNIQLAGLTPAEFNKRPHGPPGHQHQHLDDRHAPNTIWFACDYNNFHSADQKTGKSARRYVFIDAHVGDFEN
jgi:hypothetical protein